MSAQTERDWINIYYLPCAVIIRDNPIGVWKYVGGGCSPSAPVTRLIATTFDRRMHRRPSFPSWPLFAFPPGTRRGARVHKRALRSWSRGPSSSATQFRVGPPSPNASRMRSRMFVITRCTRLELSRYDNEEGATKQASLGGGKINRRRRREPRRNRN